MVMVLYHFMCVYWLNASLEVPSAELRWCRCSGSVPPTDLDTSRSEIWRAAVKGAPHPSENLCHASRFGAHILGVVVGAYFLPPASRALQRQKKHAPRVSLTKNSRSTHTWRVGKKSEHVIGLGGRGRRGGGSKKKRKEKKKFCFKVLKPVAVLYVFTVSTLFCWI